MPKFKTLHLLPAPPLPQFRPGLLKVLLSASFLTIGNTALILKEEQLHEPLNYVLFGLIWPTVLVTGTLNLFDNMLLNWVHRKNDRSDEKTLHYYSALRYKHLATHFFNFVLTMKMCERYGDMLIWASKNGRYYFSFSYPEGRTATNAGFFNFINVPIMVPIIFILSLIAIGYNLREMLLNISGKFPRRSDSPFFGFLNALAQISATASFLNQLQSTYGKQVLTIDSTEDIDQMMQRIEEALENVTKTPRVAYFFSWLNGAAAYQIYKVITLFFTNIMLTFIPCPKIEVHSEEIPSFRKRRRNRSAQNQEADMPATTAALPVIFAQPTTEATIPKNETVETARKEPKLKTRGTPGFGYAAAEVRATSIENLADIRYQQDTQQRLIKLSLIRKFRMYSQLKTQRIQKELTQLKNFLPEARLEEGDGSERALIWSYAGEHYRLKYEVPHGTRNEYSGRKLKKILNILETAYLWGWGQKNIQLYLTEHQQTGNYLGKLVNVFLRRPDFEEAADVNLPRLKW